MAFKQSIQFWQTRFTLASKLLLSFALVFFFVIVAAIVTLFQVQRLNHSSSQLALVQKRADISDQIRLGSIGQVADTLDQLWSGRTISRVDNFSVMVHTNLELLKTSETDPAMLTKLTQIEKLVNDILNFLDDTVTLDEQGRSIEARASWIKGSILFDDLNQNLTEFWNVQKTALDATKRDDDEIRGNTILVIVICSALALIAAVVLAVFLTKSIVKRVKLVSGAMQRVASDTSLEAVELDIIGGDEVAKMAQAFNCMINKLTSALQALRTTGQTVSSSSQYFAEMMQHQLASSEQEAGAVSSIVGATNQLKQMAYEIDERAKTMAAQARDNETIIHQLSNAMLTTSGQVTKTRGATQTVTEGINRILHETGQVKVEFQELVEQLSSIQRLGTGLRDIAAETHLLALNAAIESAGAGPYGERFRVVAASVKSLADQSQKMVANMGFFVRQIETKIETVMTAIIQTDQELAHNRQLIELVEEVGQENITLIAGMSDSIQRISHLVNETVSQAHNIAHATHEQRTATEDIISTIGSVQVVVNDNNQRYHTSVAAVDSLQTEVSRLNNLVSNLSTPSLAEDRPEINFRS